MKRKSFIGSLLAVLMSPFIAISNQLYPGVQVGKQRKVWRPEDIRAGLFIVRNYDHPNITVVFQIGYSLDYNLKDPSVRYRLNSSADGWSHGLVPGRPADKPSTHL